MPEGTLVIKGTRLGTNSKEVLDSKALLTFRNADVVAADPLARGWVGSPPLRQFKHVKSDYAWEMVDSEKYAMSEADRVGWQKSHNINPSKAKTPEHPPWRSAGF